MSFKLSRTQRRAEKQGAVLDVRNLATLAGVDVLDVNDSIADGLAPPPDVLLPTGLCRWTVESVRHFLTLRGDPPTVAPAVTARPSTAVDDAGGLVPVGEVVRRAAALPLGARRLWRPGVLPPPVKIIGRVRLWSSVGIDAALGRLRGRAERGFRNGGRRANIEVHHV